MTSYFSKLRGTCRPDPSTLARIVAAAMLAVLIAGPAFAQAPKPPPAAQPKPAAAARPVEGECGALPGGRAPVARIAEIKGVLSPRDLDLVYFGKALADLGVEDFERIAALSPKCGVRDGILTPEKLKSFEAVVRASQQARRTAMDGIERQKKEIAALPAGRERLMRLNALSDRLPALESELTRGDVDAMAKWIVRQTQAVYDIAPKSEATVAIMSAGPPPAAASMPTVDARPPAPATTERLRTPGREDE